MDNTKRAIILSILFVKFVNKTSAKRLIKVLTLIRSHWTSFMVYRKTLPEFGSSVPRKPESKVIWPRASFTEKGIIVS